jgi:hypothetical protein
MRHIVPLACLGLAAMLLSTAAHATEPRSAFFQASAKRLVQQHVYYHERQVGPRCGTPIARGTACLGRGGLVIWR